jgi:hypothetical protein
LFFLEPQRPKSDWLPSQLSFLSGLACLIGAFIGFGIAMEYPLAGLATTASCLYGFLVFFPRLEGALVPQDALDRLTS